MPTITNDVLDDIFGIPKDGSNIKEESDESQEGSYADVLTGNSNETFEQKSKRLNEGLAKDAPVVEVSYVDKVVSKEISNAPQKETQRPTQPKQEQPKAAAEPPKDAFEKILSKSVHVREPSSSEVQPVVQKQTVDSQDTKPSEDAQEESEAATEESTGQSVVIPKMTPNADGWLLTSPTPMLNDFYGEKFACITSITKGQGPLPIDKLMAELKSSHVSTHAELTDLPGMSQKLTTIQDFLDRVVQIKILATGQCAACKRGVELLRGVLAKILYEKPAARQDGVIYYHMKDIEMYACNVEALEESAKNVYQNLLEAKEILSRKLSIAFELLKQQNLTDSLERNYNNLPDAAKKAAAQSAAQASQKPLVSEKLASEGFDRLDVQEAVKLQSTAQKEPTKKTGKTSWMD